MRRAYKLINLVASFKENYGLVEELEWMENVQYVMPENIEELKYVLDKYSEVSDLRIGMDTETDSLDIRAATLVGISLSVRKSTSIYIPINHKNYDNNLDKDEVFDLLADFFDEKIAVFFNAKYDCGVLYYNGFYDKLSSFKTEDAMIAVYMDNTNEKDVFIGLKPAAQRYLDIQMLEFDEVTDEDSNFQETDPRLSGAYAAADADMTLRLLTMLENVWKPNGKENFIWKLENEIINVLNYMEKNTVLLDEDLIETYVQGMMNDLFIMEQNIYQMAGKIFNISSTQQVGEVLYDDIGLKPPSLTETGRRAANKNALEKLEGKHPIVSLIRSYNLTKKNLQNYLLKVQVFIEDFGPEARLNFNSIRTTSGRFASSGSLISGLTPLNAQNIPAADKFIGYEGKEILNPEDFLKSIGYEVRTFDLTEDKEKLRKTQYKKRSKKKKKKKSNEQTT